MRVALCLASGKIIVAVTAVIEIAAAAALVPVVVLGL
jgi:hypothetical protein